MVSGIDGRGMNAYNSVYSRFWDWREGRLAIELKCLEEVWWYGLGGAMGAWEG